MRNWVGGYERVNNELKHSGTRLPAIQNELQTSQLHAASPLTGGHQIWEMGSGLAIRHEG